MVGSHLQFKAIRRFLVGRDHDPGIIYKKVKAGKGKFEFFSKGYNRG